MSTNNVKITYSTRSTNLFNLNHPTLFLIKKRRSTDATGGVLNKKLFVKISQFSQGNTCLKEPPTQICSYEYCEISKKTYFEEQLRTAASEVILESDCLGLYFWRVAFKTFRTYQLLSKQTFKTQFGSYAILKFNPYVFFWTQASYVYH